MTIKPVSNINGTKPQTFKFYYVRSDGKHFQYEGYIKGETSTHYLIHDLQSNSEVHLPLQFTMVVEVKI